tara:strand:- start:39 stop:485 length:447 start_codon:yes stop_codon:yes gene_type:complete
MKKYTTFLSEQMQILNEKGPEGKFANLSATSIAGLGGGGRASDVVVSDMGSVNPLLRNANTLYDMSNIISKLPGLSNEYSEAQLKQIFNNMGNEERRRTIGYINSLKSFKDSQTMKLLDGLLKQSLEKHQVVPKTFIPNRQGNWSTRR